MTKRKRLVEPPIPLEDAVAAVLRKQAEDIGLFYTSTGKSIYGCNSEQLKWALAIAEAVRS